MFWAWQTVAHILLLQVALAFYVLVWPVLRKGAFLASRKLSKWFPESDVATDAQSARKQAYRGNWRNTEYQRTQSANKDQWQDYSKRRTEHARPSQTMRSKHLLALGLNEPVHLLDIKTAYRRLAKAYHPDRFASDRHSDDKRASAAARMREINAAYDWLRANA
ncbi:MAG: J domain-containing protein [Pseudomonadota bacterium]